MHDADRKWVTEQLSKINQPVIRQKALVKYREVFNDAFDAEPLPHRKDGKARSAANNRLRVYVEKIINL